MKTHNIFPTREPPVIEVNALQLGMKTGTIIIAQMRKMMNQFV